MRLVCEAAPPSGRHVRPRPVVAPAPSTVRHPVGGSRRGLNDSDLHRGRLVNLVTMVIAPCRAAAHADAIELEIIVQARRSGGGYGGASCGESLAYHAEWLVEASNQPSRGSSEVVASRGPCSSRSLGSPGAELLLPAPRIGRAPHQLWLWVTPSGVNGSARTARTGQSV